MVFPTSPLGSQAKGAVWFNTYKSSGCGYADDCAYDIPSIEEAAASVAELIEQEKKLLGGDASKVFLGGFSEGAQMTGYVQLAKMDYALGGTIIMDGFPIPPLCDMPGAAPAEAKKNASYYGEDMNFMVWWGNSDTIFPADYSLETWHGVFDALEIQSTLTVEHTEPLQTHSVTEKELNQVMDFVRSS